MSQKDTNKKYDSQQEKESSFSKPFIINLFIEQKCEMPDKKLMSEIMSKHIGDVDCFSYDKSLAGFSARKYPIKTDKGIVYPQLMIMNCTNSTADLKIDDFTKSQMWDCPESEEIFEKCNYNIAATELFTSIMDYKDRANLLMDYSEAVAEMFPSCKAVMFRNSEKLFLRERVVRHNIPKDSRFIYFAVNVRFFNIAGTHDHIVDTLGMSTLHLPDLQYHFHTADPNHVVQHAYSFLQYIYENNCPIKSGETVDGLKNGVMDESVRWVCHYEDSLIKPQRDVIDICMGEFAAGERGE